MSRQAGTIRRQILWPLMAAIGLILLVTFFSISYLQKSFVVMEARHHIDQVERLFNGLLEAEAKFMQVRLDTLTEDKVLQKAWLERDRQQLLAVAEPLYQQLHSQYKITHFYFVDPNRTCFLRVHNPARRGDIIERFTMRQAEETGKMSWGIELGPLGTFTLRVVAPWRINDRLVGYLELGEEIEHLTPALVSILNVDLLFRIKKSYLNRSDWEKGMAMLGRKADWDAFDQMVSIDATKNNILKEFLDLQHKTHEAPKNGIIRITTDDKIFMGGLIPLIDAGGRNVGDILVLNDWTSLSNTFQRQTLFLVLLIGGIGCLLFIIFFLYAGRIEQRLVNAFKSLSDKNREQQRTEAELRATQAQLIQSSKLASVGELAAGIAHELNQPLMVLRSKNQLMQRRLQKETLTPEHIGEAIESVNRNTKRMMNIIDHLRAFSRQSGQTEHKRELVQINKVIDDCFLMIGEQLRLRDIQIKKEFDPGLPRIQADGNQLEQVFLNLFANARDAVVEKREKCTDKESCQAEIAIHTGISEDKSHIVILISDNGCGIPKAISERIFDPFFSTKPTGTGLGMAIARRIVEDHHGRIEIESVEGQGSSVSLILPAHAEEKTS